jgi:hypothetical protein
MKKVTQQTKIFKIKGQKPEVLAIGGIFLLLCLYGIGLSVKKVFSAASYNKQPLTVQPAEPASQPEVSIVPQPVEPIYIEEPYTPVETPTPPVAMEQPIAPMQPQVNWGNNLTDEQRAGLQRLQQGLQGLASGIQIWQNISPEARQAYQNQLQELGQQVQNMSEEDRANARQKFEQQWQQWLQSDQQQLPNFSLN